MPEPPANATYSLRASASKFQLLVHPAREHAAGDLLDANLQHILAGRHTQRIIAPHFLATDLAPEGEVLAGAKFERLAQFRRQLQAHRHRI